MATSAISTGLAMPPTSGASACVADTIASRASAPPPAASSVPPSSTTTARAPSAERSSPRLSIGVPLHLAPFQRKRGRVRRPEQLAIDPRQQLAQPPLVGHGKDNHAGAFLGWKRAVVEIIPVERDERPPELPRKVEVLDVARAAKIVVLEHEQDVPPQLLAHEGDDAERHVRVGVHARLAREGIDDRTELRRECAHQHSEG